jgi:hypothetical protein
MDISEARQLMHNVPFGSSKFALETLSKELTPERQFRHTLLQLNEKLAALDLCRFTRNRIENDLEEMKEELSKERFSTVKSFDFRRIEVDIEEKELQLKNEIKLIEDAVIEVDAHLAILDGLPKFTREQFEGAEIGYWRQRLLGDAEREAISSGTVGVGTLASLQKIGAKLTNNREIVFDDVKPEQLEQK